jgi:hypothetical protein
MGNFSTMLESPLVPCEKHGGVCAGKQPQGGGQKRICDKRRSLLWAWVGSYLVQRGRISASYDGYTRGVSPIFICFYLPRASGNTSLTA